MGTRVKVMAVADVHGDFEKLDVSGVDVVIVAGDIGPGKTHDGYDSDRWARGQALVRWFNANSQVRFYILPGNHDLFAKGKERRDKIRKLWPDNAKLLYGDGWVDRSGLTIWGMPWNPEKTTSATKGGAYHADAAKIRKKCKKIANCFQNLDILVTHAPPRIANSAFDVNGWHMSEELALALPLIRPRVLICGHHHELTHVPVVTNNGDTLVVNVSMKGKGHPEGFQYEPRIIEFEVERKLDVKMDMTSDMKA